MRLSLPALLAAVGVAACGAPAPRAPLEIEWSHSPAREAGLPGSIRVFEGINPTLPLRAWRVDVDLSDSTLRVGALRSDEPDGRQTPTEFARSSGACVLINGGFYRTDLPERALQIGLLVTDGSVARPAINGILWEQVRYPVTRATIGAVGGAPPEITWVSSRRDTLVRWAEPFRNRLGRPALPPDWSRATPWPARWALSAGPVVVADGRAYAYREEEGFFDTHIPRMNPRSAVGLTADGRLLLVVVDGRQPQSRGVYLEELALLMQGLGTAWAMNLDGGGSSALVVGGRLLNRPSGTRFEREVASALSIHCP